MCGGDGAGMIEITDDGAQRLREIRDEEDAGDLIIRVVAAPG